VVPGLNHGVHSWATLGDEMRIDLMHCSAILVQIINSFSIVNVLFIADLNLIL
jgi:hypothetical protein